jgi:hypothetical protein
VRDVLEGRTPPAWVTDRVAGIVVIPDADAPNIPAAPDNAVVGDGEPLRQSRPEAPGEPYGDAGKAA